MDIHPSFPYWFTETFDPASLILPCLFLFSLIAVFASISLLIPAIAGFWIIKRREGKVDHGGGRDGRNAIVSAVLDLDAMVAVVVVAEIISVLKKIGACKVPETLFNTAARAGYFPTFPCLSPIEYLSSQKYALAESSTIAIFLSKLLLLGLRKWVGREEIVEIRDWREEGWKMWMWERAVWVSSWAFVRVMDGCSCWIRWRVIWLRREIEIGEVARRAIAVDWVDCCGCGPGFGCGSFRGSDCSS